MNIVEVQRVIGEDRDFFNLVFDDKRTMVLIGAFGFEQANFQRFAIFEACATHGIRGSNDSAFFRRLKSTFQTVAITRAGFVRFYENDLALLKLMASVQ